MIRNIALILALGAVSLEAPAAPAGAEVLQREGKWVAKFDRDSCQLIGQFGTGDKMVVMRLTRFQPGDNFNLSLFGKRLAMRGDRAVMKIDFGLKGTPVREGALLGNAGEYPAAFFMSIRFDGWMPRALGEKAPPITPEQEALVTGLTVSVNGKSFHLASGPLRKPMEIMRTCMTDLLKEWGYDPAVQAGLTRPVTPIASPGTWLRSSDYPTPALMAGHNGSVQFRLDVDDQGKVAGCYVLERTDPDDFADLTCKAVSKRAKLLPALDATGKPVRSYIVENVRWLANAGE
jgi:TonB family protein